MTKLNGPAGRCRKAERGIKFSIVSQLSRECGVSMAVRGRHTLVKGNVVTKRGIVLMGPRACVGLDNRDVQDIVSCCGISPRARLVIVCSSVDLKMKRLEVHTGNDTNKRGKVGGVVTRLNKRIFPEVGMKIKRGPPGCSLTSCILKRFSGTRRRLVDRNCSGTMGTIRLVIDSRVDRTVGRCGHGGGSR